jgi:hypothetical protein
MKNKRKKECLHDCSVEDVDIYIKVHEWETEYMYGFLDYDRNILLDEKPVVVEDPCLEWDDRIMRLLEFYFMVQLEFCLPLLHCPKDLDEFFPEEQERFIESDWTEPFVVVGHNYKEYYRYLTHGEMLIQLHAMNDPDNSIDISNECDMICRVAEDLGFMAFYDPKENKHIILQIPKEKERIHK